jgi:2,4-dienoyl-CoA reductase-like NADH-dependent reductase (Old Yellow Enzyme family)/thioredoxin reductase
MQMKLTKLLEPIKIGNLELPNRIKMPAIAPGYTPDGMVNDQLMAFYRARSKGGFGIVGVCISATEYLKNDWLGGYDDKFIPGLKQFVKMFHDNGAKVYAQVISGYAWKFPGRPVEYVSPSGISITGRVDPPYRLGGPPKGECKERRAVTLEEIEMVIEAYGDAAARAREAGFDAIEHGNATGGYFVGQFTSPLTNKRTDKYGGSLENRMRLTLETIANMQKKSGTDWPMTARVLAQYTDNALVGEDLQQVCVMLEKAGVAAIDMMSGHHEDPEPMIQPGVPQGRWVVNAELAKKVVKIPVGAGTQIQDVEVANRVIEEGRADYCYMLRAAIADPEFPKKAKEGRIEDIRRCITCCRCYETAVYDEVGLSCSVNPNTGREYQYDEPKPTREPKKIFVVGSGPSGFQVARLASLRGHDVTLFDEKRRAGGSTLLAGIIDERIGMHAKYIQTQLKKMPIKHKRLGERAVAAMVEAEKPDIVVIASGGVPPAYDIPGANGANVTSGSDIQKMLGGDVPNRGLMWRLASFFMKYMYSPGLVRTMAGGSFPFKKRVIIVGGGFAGCELGDFLLRKGKQVTIIEENTRLASDLGPIYRWVLLTRLRNGKARLETGAGVEEITRSGVKVRKGDETMFIEGDTIVLTKALQPNEKLISELSNNGAKVFAVGDGAKPAKIMEANASGFTLGHEI